MGSMDVNVWWSSVGDRVGAHHVLDDTERDRLRRFSNDAARDRFVAGAVLVRELAARFAGSDPASVRIDRRCPRCGGPHGRPVIVGSDLQVSVSHAGGVVGVAVSSVVAVGLDVESLSRMRGTDDVRLCSALGLVAGTWTSHQLLRQWTRVEAAVKATGDGLTVPAHKVDLGAPDESPVLVRYDGRTDLRMTLRDLTPGPGYTATVAVLADSLDRVIEHQLST